MDVLEPPGRDRAGQDAAPVQRDYRAPTRGLPRKTQVGVLLVIAAGLAAGLMFGLPFGPPVPTPREPAATAPAGSFKPTPQQWATLRIAPVQQILFRAAEETDGKIANDDDNTTPVFSPFTGRVTKLFVRAGDRVKRGDPLAAIASTELVQAANDLVSSAATLKTAQAQLNLAVTNEKRQHALYQAQGGALKDWQQSQVDLANAQGGLRTAQIALGAVRNRLHILGKNDQQIDAMQDNTTPQSFDPVSYVLAPIDGTVVQRQVGLEQNVVSQSNGGSSPLFSIGDMSKVWLLANARETDAPFIHLGDPVEVHVLAYPGRIFKAHITFVSPSIDPNTHRLPVRAEVENPDGALKPEMFASFTIITGEGTVSPAVPNEAVVFEGSTARVWVARQDDKTLALRQIKTGRVRDGMVQVTEGLRAGESVVTRGAVFIDRATTGD